MQKYLFKDLREKGKNHASVCNAPQLWIKKQILQMQSAAKIP
jgi:hypothetical protein